MQDCVRIVVVGDKGVGKTSLITTVVSDEFQEKVPPKIPPVLIPSRRDGDSLRTEIIDTSSKPADSHKVDEEIKRADFVCIAYDVNRPETLASVTKEWIPRVLRLKTHVPMALFGTKTDLRDGPKKRSWEELESQMQPIMDQYDDIEYVLECSVKDKESRENIDEIFWCAEQGVLYPRAPLCDASLNFTKKFTHVVKRLFQLLDVDDNGFLNDDEVRAFQRYCFGGDLEANALGEIKQAIIKVDPSFVDPVQGLTLEGFLCLFHLILERGRTETIWTVLRYFKYTNTLDLKTEFTNPPLKGAPEERPELSQAGETFLTALFLRYSNNSNVLNWKQLQRMFELLPEDMGHPWADFDFPKCCVTKRVMDDAFTSEGSEGADSTHDVRHVAPHEPITAKAWLAMWALTTLLDPDVTLRYLAYLGWEPTKPLTHALTWTRLGDPKAKRTTFLAYVMGSPKSGKASLVRSFTADPISSAMNQSQSNRSGALQGVFGVNQVSKGFTLVLEKPPSSKQLDVIEDGPRMKLCDAVLVTFDQSDPKSFDFARDLFERIDAVAPTLPILFVATKCDKPAAPFDPKNERENPVLFAQRKRIDPPIRTSVKDGDVSRAFATAVDAITNYKGLKRHASSSSALVKWSLIGSALMVTLYTAFIAGRHYSLHRTLRGLTIDDFVPLGRAQIAASTSRAQILDLK